MDEPHKVVLKPSAQRQLPRLPEKVALAALEFIDGQLALNPQRVGKRLAEPLSALHSARRGDYRIVCAIDDDRRAVSVHRIEHRADVYRP